MKRHEVGIALVSGIAAGAVAAMTCAILLPYFQFIITSILWGTLSPDMEIRPTVRDLIGYPRLWIPYVFWGGLSSIVTYRLNGDPKLYPALVTCLILLLATREWFTGGVMVWLSRLGQDWRHDVVDLAALTLELLIASTLILAMPKWQRLLHNVLAPFVSHISG